MKAPFYYAFRSRRVQTMANGEMDFIHDEKIFENEQPILAREQAFECFQNYVDVLLQPMDKTYVSDKQAREDLQNFISLKVFDGIIRSNRYVSPVKEAVIGVYLTRSEQMKDLGDNWDSEILKGPIHAIGLAFQWSPDDMMNCLKEEYKLYQHHRFDTKNHDKIVKFFGVPSDTGEEPEPELRTYDILETPFDWTGFD